MKNENRLDRFYEGLTPSKLCSAPPDALNGVSSSDAERLKAAFGIDTIREMADLKYYVRARELVALADKEAQK